MFSCSFTIGTPCFTLPDGQMLLVKGGFCILMRDKKMFCLLLMVQFPMIEKWRRSTMTLKYEIVIQILNAAFSIKLLTLMEQRLQNIYSQ